MTASSLTPADYDRLMQANLKRVFNEREVSRRLAAIGELYAENAVLNEPDASVQGHLAISDAVTALLDSLPADFVIVAQAPASGHHGIGRMAWRIGPPDGPVAVTGMDIAHFEGDRIHSLTVFLDRAPD